MKRFTNVNRAQDRFSFTTFSVGCINSMFLKKYVVDDKVRLLTLGIFH